MTASAHPLIAAIAFAGHRAIARGPLDQVALAVRDWQAQHAETGVLVFDAEQGRVLDLDLRGTDSEIVARLQADAARRLDGAAVQASDAGAPRGRGRPRLGVVSREVTLLPRHWDWLAVQPGGASVTLRKLVEAARRAQAGGESARMAQEACWRFMSALGGDLPGFEEASRALFARQRERFVEELQAWPEDVRAQALALAERAFGSG
ncbi:MAG: DUF2239 family protein [Lysobacterales bacterium]